MYIDNEKKLQPKPAKKYKGTIDDIEQIRFIDEFHITAHVLKLTQDEVSTVLTITVYEYGGMVPFGKLRITNEQGTKLWKDEKFTEKTGISYHIACRIARHFI